MAVLHLKLTVALFFSMCLLLLLPLSSATSLNFVSCTINKSNPPVQIKAIDVTPYPVKGSETVTFTLKATTGQNIKGGKLVFNVKYSTLQLRRETDDICSDTACPVSGDFVISHSEALPGFTPPGSYTIRMELVDGSNNQLACITFGFTSTR